MSFQVFQDNKPCSSYKMHESWKIDTFKTKREAEVYAYAWAYPYSLDECLKIAPQMDVGREYDYGMTQHPVMMKIMEIK